MSTAPITFVVPGHPSAAGTRGAAAEAPPRGHRGTLKASVRVAARRGEGGEVRVSAVPGEDIVLLHVENGPSLTLHPENARDLILAQAGTGTDRSARGAAAGDGEVRIPPHLRWRGLGAAAPARGGTRGRFGDVLLKGIDVITDAAKEFATDFVLGKVQSLAASKLVALVDDQVDEAVYALDPRGLGSLKSAAASKADALPAGDGPLLVLVHGTFSSTSGTFAKLWTEHPDLVERLFRHYADRVFALDHRTLGASPVGNALTLARTLGRGSRLHLVTHSRGGLVGEVLARACGSTDARLDLFGGSDHKKHREQVAELIDLVKSREIRVERVVRVACPARGTLLASKRLDAYLSVFKWTLELAGVPVLPSLVSFIDGVAQHRADPALIPGLAAQIPNSPLVQWLHEVDAPIGGDLRVVAGDLEGDSIASWLKTLLADAFYWTDNDLVVQTRSMYGGTPRAAAGTFALTRGGKVSHFSYFGGGQAAGAIVDALTEEMPSEFRPIGPMSYAGKDSEGLRAARRGGAPGRQKDKPAVILVPGVFGSHLAAGRARVWLDWTAPNPLKRLAYGVSAVKPDGLVGDFYGDLTTYLADTHEVIEFAYDWRQPIEESARRLGSVVESALAERDASGQAVRLLAHSTGGLVARAVQFERPDVWDRWMSHPEARLVMLGTPNAGFWAPMQVLSGDDTLGGAVALLGAPFRERETRQVLAGFPGFVQLQAGLLDDTLQLSRHTTWRDLADDDARRAADSSSWHTDDLQRRALEWGIPAQGLLDAALTLHGRLDAQRRHLDDVADKLLLVRGHAPLTPEGYDVGTDGLTYRYGTSGDGYVTHDSASLPGVRTWVADCDHARLPSTTTVFDAYLDLLQRGSTDRLPSAAQGAPRDAARAVVRSRPARSGGAVVPPASYEQLFGADRQQATPAEDETRLRVTVVNGDLAFVRQPLMLGHYRSSKLTGTEFVMNGLVGGAMNASLEKGQYPDGPGSHQVFLNTRVDPDDPRQLPRPEAVVIVGLGEEGKLKPAHLIATVRQGVLAWAQRLSETAEPPSTFELASTLISSGGIGMGVGQAAQLIVQAVREANERITREPDAGGGDAGRPWPSVAHLTLIELYLDRATEAWRALRMTPDASARQYVLTEVVESDDGALPRPIDSSYRGADYDFIRAETLDGAAGKGIAYTMDTRRARSEDRPQPVQGALLRTLIEDAASDQNRDPQIGRTLFRLLIPVEMEPLLTGDTEAQIEVDSGTAGIPWELIDAPPQGRVDARPWAIRTKLLRKLRTGEFRAQVADAGADAHVLVIGEPECDESSYPRLPGAREEALGVGRALAGGGLRQGQVRVLASEEPRKYGPDARTVINALLERDWRIVHIAGHGELPDDSGPARALREARARAADPRGVVLSNGVYLGPGEINSMRRVPELVFVNCCYLARSDDDALLAGTRCGGRNTGARARFASGVADALIKVGVRCVIAAGWAVEDEPAMVFAQKFYEALLAQHRFIDAVAAARHAAWLLGGNTWGAYQCYGDPDWTLSWAGGDAQRPVTAVRDEFAAIASQRDLLLALRTIAVRCKYQKQSKEKQRAHLRSLEQRFAARWGANGAVAELFGAAWADAGDHAAALEWYRTALKANDGTASIRAVEQRGNLQVRLAWEAVDTLYRRKGTLQAAAAADAAGSGNGSGEPSPGLAAAGREFDAAIASARAQVEAGIELLERLVALETSMERESLLGSAYKRQALIAALARDASQERAAIEAMKHHYEQAEHLGREHNRKGFYYPALNRLAAEFALDGAAGAVRLDDRVVEAIRADLEAVVREKPDFWNVVSQTDLALYQALARRDLAAQLPAIVHAYDDLYRRVGHAWMWKSVYDQAEFVLPKYTAHATPPEQDAAERLRRHLRGLAGGGV